MAIKILLAEDEAGIREGMAYHLEKSGFENILLTDKGQEAIELIEKEKPDFVFLDFSLSDNMTGMEVLKKARELSSETKCIMMSAYKGDCKDEAMRLGAWYYLTKPFQMDDVIRLLFESLKQERSNG